MIDVIKLTKTLINKESITPNDGGCQELFKEILGDIGFTNETMVFEDTTNLWSRKGRAKPVFCFAGHTDVVPTGPIDKWQSPPFEATEKDGFIYGRGAADMKASLAAMMLATKKFVTEYPMHKGSIAFLITSDEEGPFINGTTRVIDTLEERNEKIDYCIVGEPSSTVRTGDVIKNGRRGSLTGTLVIHGVQGHVAYPHLVKNPIHLAAPAISELAETVWDNGNEFFPATSMQISNIHAGTGATNVVPGSIELVFNIRYSTEVTAEQLQQGVLDILDKHQLNYTIAWIKNGLPFITPEGNLVNACQEAISETLGINAQLSTAGGTSDGRFIAPTGAQVVELGPENSTIHKVNECVNIENVKHLEQVYYAILVKLMS